MYSNNIDIFYSIFWDILQESWTTLSRLKMLALTLTEEGLINQYETFSYKVWLINRKNNDNVKNVIAYLMRVPVRMEITSAV